MDDQKDAPRAARLPPSAIRQQRRDIIVVGGSAGALDTMLDIARAFPREFNGSIFIVSHIGGNRSHLPDLLTRAGVLPAAHPEDGEPIRPGKIYVAPPDRHMLLDGGHIRLSRGPRQHFTRPAVDPLFRSASDSFGSRVIGVVLSGTGSDGVVGLERIARGGGVTVVQEPDDALHPEMPSSAAAIGVNYVVPSGKLPALLTRLSCEKVSIMPPTKADRTKVAMEELERPVALTCPECGGALHEVEGTSVKQYRCHTGHRFSPEEVLTGQDGEVERALGVALRVLNERVELCRHMGENARAGGRAMGVTHWRRLQREAEEQLQVLQRFLTHRPGATIVEDKVGAA